MAKRGYYRSSGRTSVRPTVTPTVPAPLGAAMRPSEVCGTGLLALGVSFVFGCLVATVAWSGSIPELLLGLMIGLTFVAAGALVLCVAGESPSRRADRVSTRTASAVLAAAVFVGNGLGVLL